MTLIMHKQLVQLIRVMIYLFMRNTFPYILLTILNNYDFCPSSFAKAINVDTEIVLDWLYDRKEPTYRDLSTIVTKLPISPDMVLRTPPSILDIFHN